MGRAWDVQKWQAEYIPTRKNMQVADFWTKNGFVPMGERADRKTYVRDAREGGGAIPAYICVQED
jgi:predicted enzyme involved in methoxymalonyl-ACP biosynthesis